MMMTNISDPLKNSGWMQGDQLHALACQLFLNNKKTTVDTADLLCCLCDWGLMTFSDWQQSQPGFSSGTTREIKAELPSGVG